MKRYVYIPLVTVLASCAVFKGGKKKAGNNSAASAVAATPATKTGVKPFKDVITPGMITQKGLVTVHSTPEKDTILFEIGKELLGRDMLALSYIKKISTDISIYPGELIDSRGVYFERTTNDRILLREHKVETLSNPGDAIHTSVVSSNTDAVLAILPILAYGKDSASYVIDIAPVVKNGQSLFNNFFEKRLTDNFSPAALSNHTITDLRVFATNVMIAVSKEGEIRKKGVEGNSPFLFETSTSFLLLPEKPMVPRLKDKRIGYFSSVMSTFYDSAHEERDRAIVNRWRIEPKPEDVEKYMRGELVEPAKPIVIYIDPATPKKYVSYLIQGVNDWNPAFEQAGFKNAITAKPWPVNDSTFDINDAGYSILYYLPSKVYNAYGPSFCDPRSGEIMQTHIGWFSNISALISNWYKIQAGVNDKRAQKTKLDDEVIGELVRFVSSHEVGHTLGLSHNFGSSSQTPVDSLRSITFLKKYGHTASIMDYARFNYAAQPQDNIPAELLMPRIGDYDKWAIEWGYKYTGIKDLNQDATVMVKLTDKRLAENHRLFFGDGEDRENVDARNQTEDLSDNLAVADSLGLANMRIVMKNLLEWNKDDNNAELNSNNFYEELYTHYFRFILQNLQIVDGVTTNLQRDGSSDAVFVPMPKDKQIGALRFICRELFEEGDWIDDPAIMNHFFVPMVQGYLTDMRRRALCIIFSPEILTGLQNREMRFGSEKMVTIEEVVDMAHSYIWKNLENGSFTSDPEIRNLQRSYVNSLLYILLNPDPQVANSSISVPLHTELTKLIGMIKTSIPKADSETKEHLLDLKERIYRLTRKG